MKKLISWNVNGIRAAERKGLLDWLQKESPDALFLQETKAHPDQLSGDLLEPRGYHTYWMSAEKKGYSGTALYCREKPEEVAPLGWKEGDQEGRILFAHWPRFSVMNGYFPNSQAEGKRLGYKLEFCAAAREALDQFQRNHPDRLLLVCGDFNIAHRAIDLANPRRNEGNPGYLPEERAWMEGFAQAGYADTFREAHPDEPEHYSWWSYRFKAREKNIGWRLDYFWTPRPHLNQTAEPLILKDVQGSDHCPVGISLPNIS